MAPDEAVVGCTGELVVGTRGAAGPGEVLVRVRGGTETFLAHSEQPLGRGATVLITESLGHRQVTVMAWGDLAPGDGGGAR